MRFPALSMAAAITTFAATPDCGVTGPSSHDNLSIYLVSRPERRSIDPTSRSTKLDRHMVTVYETSDVNTLLVANVSKEEVYIQSVISHTRTW